MMSSGDGPSLDCRFYENQYPEVDELVMVNVRSIAEMGAYVSLLEYNNQEGMILLSELSRRRIRSINKLIRVGKNEVVMVLRVDKEKGYIDLSKRRVSPEDVMKFEDKYNKAKTVHSMLRHVAAVSNVDVENLYTSIGWPLARKYGQAYDAFKLAISDPDTIFEGLEMSAEIRDILMSDIRRRLTPQPIKVRAYIEATCYAYAGIDALRTALVAGEEAGTEEAPIKLTLVAPPVYVLDTVTLNPTAGVAAQTAAIEAITASLEAAGGNLTVKSEPKAISQREDQELAQMLEKLEMENREVDGDAAEED